jgi:mRNA interferase RelE/StbE
VAGYRVLVKPSAEKDIDGIEPKKARQRIAGVIRALADEPRPSGCQKLSASEDRYRVRQGPYRVVYEVEDGERTVTVVKVGHRRDVYK